MPTPATSLPFPATDWWRPTAGMAWQWQIGGGTLDFDLQVDVWDIDLGVHKSVVTNFIALWRALACRWQKRP